MLANTGEWSCVICLVCFGFLVRMRSCVGKCCWVLVQDRCELDVAYFCCVVKYFFNGLLWHFLFCFSCCFCFVVLTRFGSAVLLPFCCVCTTFVGAPGCYMYKINYALFAVSFCVCLGENLTCFCCFVLYQCLCTNLGTRIIAFCSLFPLTPLPPPFACRW